MSRERSNNDHRKHRHMALLSPPTSIKLPAVLVRPSKGGGKSNTNNNDQQEKNRASPPGASYRRGKVAHDPRSPSKASDAPDHRGRKDEHRRGRHRHRDGRKQQRSPPQPQANKNKQPQERCEQSKKNVYKETRRSQTRRTAVASSQDHAVAEQRKPMEPEEEGVAQVVAQSRSRAFRRYQQLPSSGKKNTIYSSMPPQRQSRHPRQQVDHGISSSMPPVLNIHIDGKHDDSSSSSSDSDGSESSSSYSTSSSSSSSTTSSSSSSESSSDNSNNSSFVIRSHPASIYIKEEDVISSTPPASRHRSNNTKPSSATVSSTDASTVYEDNIDVRGNAFQPLGKTPSYKALLAVMESRRRSMESPVHSDYSGGYDDHNDKDVVGYAQYESNETMEKARKSPSEKGRTSDSNHYHLKRRTSEKSNNDDHDESFDSMYSKSPNSPADTAPASPLQQLPSLPFSPEKNLMQKQIQYLHHEAVGNDTAKKPEIEYITEELEQIKKQQENIHKRAEDEVVQVQQQVITTTTTHCQTENLLDVQGYSSHSIHSEEEISLNDRLSFLHNTTGRRESSTCTDNNHNSSIWLADMEKSLHLSDIEFRK